MPRASANLLTTKALVLLHVSRQPRASLEEISRAVGAGERHVQRLISELEEAGMISRVREGKRNSYTTNPEVELPDLGVNGTVGDLLAALDRDCAL